MAKVKKLMYKIEDGTIELELDDFETEDPDYKPYGKSKNIIGMMYLKEYLSANEKIIISNPYDMICQNN